MAYKILKAEQRGPFYHFSVHLDEAFVDDEGVPDAEFVREWFWSANPPPVPDYPADHRGDRVMEPMTQAEYQDCIKAMIGEHVATELALIKGSPHAPVALNFFLKETE